VTFFWSRENIEPGVQQITPGSIPVKRDQSKLNYIGSEGSFRGYPELTEMGWYEGSGRWKFDPL